MMNIKNHYLYSDKFTFSVINLKQIGTATEKDKAYQLDQWAAFFKSTKRKEIQMLAQGNNFIQEAAQTMYQLSAEEAIRQQCEAREDAERVWDGLVESRDKYKAMAEAAQAQVTDAKAQTEAQVRAEAAEMQLNAIKEELKLMREEMEALKRRP